MCTHIHTHTHTLRVCARWIELAHISLSPFFAVMSGSCDYVIVQGTTSTCKPSFWSIAGITDSELFIYCIYMLHLSHDYVFIQVKGLATAIVLEIVEVELDYLLFAQI